jgi:predicted metal-dependent hydrolase
MSREQAPDADPEQLALEGLVGEIEVRRSARRRRTVSAFREGDRTVVLVPARMSVAEANRWAREMADKLDQREAKRRPSDSQLMTRAMELSKRYLDGKARPASVEWSQTQQKRWGSCTPADGSIRISKRLEGVPEWVLDYVLLHELAHLLVADHSPRFHALLADYPKLERARGFLEGLAHHDDTAS